MVALMSALVLVIGVLSAITTAIVECIIMWCVMKKRYKHPQSTSGHYMQDDKSGTHELTSKVNDVPVLKDHQNQTISTQDNVAYGGTIPLQQNVAYEQASICSLIALLSCGIACIIYWLFVYTTIISHTKYYQLK